MLIARYVYTAGIQRITVDGFSDQCKMRSVCIQVKIRIIDMFIMHHYFLDPILSDFIENNSYLFNHYQNLVR